MAVSRPLLTLPVTATAIILAKYFVTAAGAVCGAGAKALGVSQFNTDTGNQISVVALGTAVVIAGAAITAGAYVASDANGKAVTAVLTVLSNGTAAGVPGDVVLGIALEAANAAGDEIEVQVNVIGATPA